jgi:hypothetical protein
MSKSRITWPGHVVCTGKQEMLAEFCSEDPKGRDHLGDLGIDEIMLKWILDKQGMRLQTRLNWLRIGPSGGFL